MNNHCSNGRSPEPADPHTPSPSSEHIPLDSFTYTFEGRLLLSEENAPLIDAVGYDAFGNCLDGCDFHPEEQEEDSLLTASYREYNPTPGSWMPEDAMRFAGDDPNLFRYVHLSPPGHSE